MFLAYLPDEMKIDFETALRLGAEWGLRAIELRAVDGVNVVDLTDEQVKQTQLLLARYEMRVAGLATPFFKCTLPGQQADDQGDMHSARPLTYNDHVGLLPRGVQLAQAFGAPSLRIFSFWRQDGADFWPALTEAVTAILDATAGSNVTPCLENEGACFIGTSAELAEAAQRFAATGLQFIWDPGNSTARGMSPRAADFAHFAGRIAQVHLKDSRYNPALGKASTMVIGAGDTDYHAQLRWLHDIGYTGALTLEPHYCPGGDCIEGMRQSIAAIRRVAAAVGVDLSV
jgi:sugar phosphate isomerase/epimerase